MKPFPKLLALAAILSGWLACDTLDLPVPEPEPFRLEEYEIIVEATAGTKMTTAGTWEDGDEIYIALDGRDKDVYRLQYSAGTDRFTIYTVPGAVNQGFRDAGTTVALHAHKATLAFKNGKFCGTTDGDVVYAKDGTYTKEGKTVTFKMHLGTRDMSLVKVRGAGRSCKIRNLVNYTSLTSLADLEWDLTSTRVSAIYDKDADIAYCYGSLPEDRLVQLQYDNEAEQAWYRKATVTALSGSEMTTIDGPVNAPGDWDLHYDFDHYETGDIITWHTATVTSPVQIIVTGDGFDVYDLKKGGNFEKWGSYVMEKLFSIEPYKTYKDCFTVVLVAAVSPERGVSIGDNKKNTYFNVGWQDATHYGSMMNATSRARLQSLAQQIPGYSSTRSFALVLCNTDTYGGLCYWSQHVALASMCLNSSWTAPRSLTWNGRWDTSTGQTSGDVANLVAHELGGHAIGYLTDEYPSSEFNRTSILSNQMVGFANNLALDKSNPGWKSFKQEIQEAGGYATGNAGLGEYLCKNDVYRSDYQGCMADNRLVWGIWNRYLIAKRIHSLTGQDYSVSDFIREVPKQVTDPTWKIQRSKGFPRSSLIDYSENTFVPLGAEPINE